MVSNLYLAAVIMVWYPVQGYMGQEGHALGNRQTKPDHQVVIFGVYKTKAELHEQGLI